MPKNYQKFHLYDPKKSNRKVSNLGTKTYPRSSAMLNKLGSRSLAFWWVQQPHGRNFRGLLVRFLLQTRIESIASLNSKLYSICQFSPPKKNICNCEKKKKKKPRNGGREPYSKLAWLQRARRCESHRGFVARKLPGTWFSATAPALKTKELRGKTSAVSTVYVSLWVWIKLQAISGLSFKAFFPTH